jgi:hypothetical protein
MDEGGGFVSSSHMLVRWIALVLAIMALLSATVLHRASHDLLARVGIRPNERLFRVWHWMWAAVFAGLWWFLGTPAGTRAWSALTR